MSQNSDIHRIVEIAQRDGGVTVNPVTLYLIDSADEWIFPMYPELTVVVPEKRLEGALAEFLANHRDKYRDIDAYVGIWRKDEKYFIDLNAHASTLDEATKLARSYADHSQRDIISAYNPATDQTYYF